MFRQLGIMECWARSEALAPYWNNGREPITSVFDLRMRFHVTAQAKNKDQDARAHDLDVSRQLLYELICCLNEKFKTYFAIHLPWFFA